LGLADKLSDLTSASIEKTIGCPVALLINSLSEEDATALTRALKSPASTRSIHIALRAEGYTVDRDLLGRHRKGFCRCRENNNE
jgi:hypothetical protein